MISFLLSSRPRHPTLAVLQVFFVAVPLRKIAGCTLQKKQKTNWNETLKMKQLFGSAEWGWQTERNEKKTKPLKKQQQNRSVTFCKTFFMVHVTM